MDMLARAAPPPGSADAGDLYVDLQTRTLWLGVEAVVNDDEFVLISDMVALQAEIDGAVVEGKAYTDAQVLTRAPAVHTHTSTQITDFTPAVTAIAGSITSLQFVRGMVTLWSGTLAEIGVGSLATWSLCDGRQFQLPAIPPATGMVTVKTPDLRDKFILGAGHKVVGPPSEQPASFNTTGGGTHIHTVNPTAITDAQMPNHNHGGVTGLQSANHTHNVNLVTDAQGNHAHTLPVRSGYVNGQPYPGSSSSGVTGNPVTSTAGLHQHNVDGNTGINSASHNHSIPAEGSGQGHTHTILGGGGIHEHTITGVQLRDSLPYYVLAYIMKL